MLHRKSIVALISCDQLSVIAPMVSPVVSETVFCHFPYWGIIEFRSASTPPLTQPVRGCRSNVNWSPIYAVEQVLGSGQLAPFVKGDRAAKDILLGRSNRILDMVSLKKSVNSAFLIDPAKLRLQYSICL